MTTARVDHGRALRNKKELDRSFWTSLRDLVLVCTRTRLTSSPFFAARHKTMHQPGARYRRKPPSDRAFAVYIRCRALSLVLQRYRVEERHRHTPSLLNRPAFFVSAPSEVRADGTSRSLPKFLCCRIFVEFSLYDRKAVEIFNSVLQK